MKRLINYIFGEKRYVVNVADMYSGVKIIEFKKIKELNDFADELNKKENYQYMIQKIEKKRVIPFTYKKQINHRKLGFFVDDVTEMVNVGNHDYSYLKIDDSLVNVIREDL